MKKITVNRQNLEGVYTGVKDKKGITLVALVVTIIILLILAGASISALSGSGLFEKTKLAKQNYQNAEEEERTTIEEYEKSISQIVGSREGLTESEIRQIVRDEINKNLGNSGSKEIIWNTTQGGTREIDFSSLNKNISDYDLLIVYYSTVNSSGEITFDTSETAEYYTNYTYSSSYVFGPIKVDLQNNKITMAATSNDAGWMNESQTYLNKIVGIKL